MDSQTLWLSIVPGVCLTVMTRTVQCLRAVIGPVVTDCCELLAAESYTAVVICV